MFIHTISNKQDNDKNNFPHPWFVTGLTDGEGTFVLGFRKSNDSRMGYQITAIYKIALPPYEVRGDNKKDHDLLYSIKNFFGVGKITTPSLPEKIVYSI